MSLCLCLETQWRDNNESGILQISIKNQEAGEETKGLGQLHRLHPCVFLGWVLSPIDRNLLEHLSCAGWLERFPDSVAKAQEW